jgi:predicted MFS family arabinose efflux permease
MKRIVLLGLGAFVVASDGTLVIGLLRQVAATLSVSVSTAGQAVTLFALVYAIGGPLLVRALRRARPERVLVGALALFVGANAMTGAAPSMGFLLGARVLAAACAGVFMPLAALVAARTVPGEKEGRALAIVVGGASAATAIGVPLGTFVGGAFGWRTSFYAIAVVTAIVAVALWLEPSAEHVAPEPVQQERPVEALLTLATTLVWAAGSFTFFTYIAVVLHRTAAIGTTGLALYLLVFGLTGIGGAAASGWLTDMKGAFTALSLALVMVAAALTALGAIALLGSGRSAGLSALAVAVYGVGTWAVTPAQQKRLVGLGNSEVLLSLNASALYGGVAVGSIVGGFLLTGAGGIARLCFIAAGLEVTALVVAACTLAAHDRPKRSGLPGTSPRW